MDPNAACRKARIKGNNPYQLVFLHYAGSVSEYLALLQFEGKGITREFIVIHGDEVSANAPLKNANQGKSNKLGALVLGGGRDWTGSCTAMPDSRQVYPRNHFRE